MRGQGCWASVYCICKMEPINLTFVQQELWVARDPKL